ncbi:MAG TPA: alpha/beta hydrolase [Albitalea sp.]|nr:alpha/beta hydrolase [Albitalea sp.]
MSVLTGCRALAGLLLAAAALRASADTAPAPCSVTGIRNQVQCGAVTRALDPAQPGGVKIDIHYVVVPALARRKLPDPVFLLAGGPGQSAIGAAPQVLPLFTRLNNRRDIVFVDQRGTGRSAPLECEDPRYRPLAAQSDPERQVAEMAACREALRKRPYGGLRFFTTTIAMQDLDAVRRALGAERINLVGASYGTRAALEYQRQFPSHVRRSVIDGVAPPDMVLPQSVGTDGTAALEAMFEACRAEPACRAAHPDLRGDWSALLAGLPKVVTVAHPLGGQPETFTLTQDMVRGALRGPLYVPSLTAALPQAIAEAAHGHVEALVGLNSMFVARKGMALAMGMHFSVICSEDYPRMAHGADASEPPFGRDFTRLYERVCADWPRGEVVPAFYQVPRSATPVLLLSGGADPVTPPRHAERVARALGPNALHVVVPNSGHGVLGIGCMRDVLWRFIDAEDDRQALAVDASCAKAVPRPPAYEPLILVPKAPT